MLSWFRKWFERATTETHVQPPLSKVRVTFDDETISVRDAAGVASHLAWSDLISISIITDDSGPFGLDLSWVLTAEKGQMLVVPMGAVGEHEFLHAMQERLEEFDNITVIEAMGSVENATFTVWEQGPPVRKPVV